MCQKFEGNCGLRVLHQMIFRNMLKRWKNQKIVGVMHCANVKMEIGAHWAMSPKIVPKTFSELNQ